MGEKFSCFAATVLGGLALVLVITNIGLSAWDNDLKRQIDERQAVINRGGGQRQLTINIARALGDIADKHNDKAIHEMLFAEDEPSTALERH